ncbi:deoxyuridine 5'-triphosphate nucleotidohydrolase-like [Cryptomeria japonica]|uniref:deoxyuridine 5'-triphosphate nucleotidohydrolase-like n=1 Tax=Cryptomeria japonica TaxID=3369 RepID=UPI0027DA75B7|nr:deoxyuridine 5'-triphosphate nucleotidohydrolase-like [Cryptomeria japonica]
MGSSTGGSVNVYTMRPPTTTTNSTNTTMSPCMFSRIQHTHWMLVVAVFLASVDTFTKDVIVLIGYTEEAVKLVTPIREGAYDRIAPHSGLTRKHSIAVGAKVIDADCRGLIVLTPFNHADQDI